MVAVLSYVRGVVVVKDLVLLLYLVEIDLDVVSRK